jgi:hypothetical protein
MIIIYLKTDSESLRAEKTFDILIKLIDLAHPLSFPLVGNPSSPPL